MLRRRADSALNMAHLVSMFECLCEVATAPATLSTAKPSDAAHAAAEPSADDLDLSVSYDAFLKAAAAEPLLGSLVSPSTFAKVRASER